jgi:hypothetical protein
MDTAKFVPGDATAKRYGAAIFEKCAGRKAISLQSCPTTKERHGGMMPLCNGKGEGGGEDVGGKLRGIIASDPRAGAHSRAPQKQGRRIWTGRNSTEHNTSQS